MASKFFSLALLVLALILGAWLWRHFIDKPRISTRIEWYEKPIALPAKVESKVGRTVPLTPETAKRESVFVAAPCDSLRDWAIEQLMPFSTTFEDTTSFSDSTTIFFAREITTIDADPWTRVITKARRFEDAYLKAARVTTTETTTEINWLVTGAAFVLGMLAALLLLR